MVTMVSPSVEDRIYNYITQVDYEIQVLYDVYRQILNSDYIHPKHFDMVTVTAIDKLLTTLSHVIMTM